MGGLKRVLLVLVFIVFAIATYWIETWPVTPPKPPAQKDQDPLRPLHSPAPAPPANTDPQVVEFSGEGLNEKLLRVNTSVTGAGNVKIARRIVGEARWILVLAAGVGKHASLDGTWTLADFPELTAAGFQEPPPPILQSMSILQSLTRSEMKYSAEAGDRIVVLFCPKDDWERLKVRWPK